MYALARERWLLFVLWLMFPAALCVSELEHFSAKIRCRAVVEAGKGHSLLICPASSSPPHVQTMLSVRACVCFAIWRAANGANSKFIVNNVIHLANNSLNLDGRRGVWMRFVQYTTVCICIRSMILESNGIKTCKNNLCACRPSVSQRCDCEKSKGRMNTNTVTVLHKSRRCFC